MAAQDEDVYSQIAGGIRSRAAFNALAKIYGPSYADPKAAELSINAAGQPSEIALRQAQSGLATAQTGEVAPNAASLRAEQAASAQNFLATAGKTAAETPEIAPNAASTRAAQAAAAEASRAAAAKNAAETPEIAPNAASTRAEQAASAAASRAGAANAYATAAKTTQATHEAADLQSAQDSLALVNTLQNVRKRAASAPGFGIQRDAGGAAVAAHLRGLDPQQLHAMGVDPAHVQPLIATLEKNPAHLDDIQQALETKIGTSSGTLDPATAQMLGETFRKTGVMPPLGQGKAGTANRLIVAKVAAQQAAAAGESGSDVVDARQQVKARQTFVNDLGKSSPTSAGGITRSAGAVLAHMDTLSQYIDALQNKNMRAANALGQDFKEQTGKAAPTAFDAQKTIVADELGRFLISRGGTGADREALQQGLKRAGSPAQLKAVIETYKTDIVGQLTALQQQATALKAEPDFNNTLTPRARALLAQHAAPAADAGGGFKYLGKE